MNVYGIVFFLLLILYRCLQLLSIIVFGSITSQGWVYDPAAKKDVCLYNGDPNACNYGVGIGKDSTRYCL